MAKRGASSELNHDNWDQEEPPEIAGTFQKASTDVMQQRIVKVAKRRSTGLSDQGAAKNVFSGFSGFKSDSTSKPTTNLSSTFSFLKNNAAPAATNGVSNPPQSLNFAVSSSTNNLFGGTTAAAQSSGMNNSNKDGSGEKYPAKLIRLNQCVADWIKSHVDKDPSCILTPIFRDYERYLKEIEEEKNKVSSEKTDKKDSNLGETNLISSSNISASGSSFKFNQPTDNTSNLNKSTDNIIKLPSSSPAAGSPSHSIFSTFKTDDNKSNVSGMSFLLNKPDPDSLMLNPFTTSLKKLQDDRSGVTDDVNKSKIPGSIFKATQDPATTSTSSGFSLGSSKMLSFSTASTSGQSSSDKLGKDRSNDNDGDGEESEEPPKAEFTPVQEKDAVYNKRCKVFLKKETNYSDLGVGTLYIKPVSDGKNQLIVRADTSLGNILLNVILTAAIPTQRMGKNNVMIICIPPMPVGSKKEPAPCPMLLRVKTAEEADELLKIIEKYKKL